MENENQNEFEVVVNNKRKTILIIIFVILLIFLLIGAGFYLFFLRLTPSNYLDYFKEETTGYITNIFESLEDFTIKETKTVIDKGVITVKTDSEDLKILNNYKINLDIKRKTNNINLNMDLYNKDNEILKSSVYMKDNTLYFKADSLYDKVIKLYSEDKIENVEIKGLDEDISNLFEAYLEALKGSKTSSRNVSFTKVKYTYEINEDNQDKIIKKFKDLYEKEKLNRVLEIEDFNTLFEIAKIEITANRFNNQLYGLVLTTKENKYEFMKDLDLDIYNITKDNVKIGSIKIVDNEFTIESIENSKVTSSLTLKTLTDGVEFDYTEGKSSFSTSLREISKEDLRISLKILDEEDDIDIDISGDIKKEADKKTVSILGTLTFAEEKIQIDYKGDKTYTNEELEFEGLDNSVEIKDISENDINKIIERFAGIILTSGLLNSLDFNNRV